MYSLALYPIYDDGPNGAVRPHYTLQRAFESHFFPCYTYDWVYRAKKLGKEKSQKEFIEILKDKRPDYTFMQINPYAMTPMTMREISKYTNVINWSGDFRQEESWYKIYENIGREIFLSLFSSTTDVDILTKRGVRADYLQVGYDTGWYYPGEPIHNDFDIVFSAHNYGKFAHSKYRGQVAVALRDEFGSRFRLFGGGWDRLGFKTTVTNCQQEAEAYRSAKIGISVSNFSIARYHSDRLLRIMGCACLPMSHDYEGLALDYQDGENIVVFKDIPHLIEQCHYYLKNEEARRIVAQNAYLKAVNECTWDSRCKELLQLIEKWR